MVTYTLDSLTARQVLDRVLVGFVAWNGSKAPHSPIYEGFPKIRGRFSEVPRIMKPVSSCSTHPPPALD